MPDVFWQNKVRAIEERIARKEDMSKFLHWPEISSTCYAASVPDIQDKFSIIPIDWYEALVEDPYGSPTPSKVYPKSSDNLIQQAYHLRIFEELSQARIYEFNVFFEIGGGYGAMARLVRRMGCYGIYMILDLPVMNALQDLYLRKAGVSWISYCSTDTKLDETIKFRPEVVFGIHSVSEMSIQEREYLVNNLKPKKWFFAFGQKFENRIDNYRWFFGKLPQILPQYSWRSFSKPPTYYMLGECSDVNNL